jgi:hypothetical protein
MRVPREPESLLRSAMSELDLSNKGRATECSDEEIIIRVSDTEFLLVEHEVVNLDPLAAALTLIIVGLPRAGQQILDISACVCDRARTKHLKVYP